MDAIDLKIIKLLESNSRVSLTQLAKQVYLSLPAISARVEKMEETGLIRRYTAMLDPQKMGITITAFINISMNANNQKDFIEYVQTNANITECYHVAGPYSMLLKAMFTSTSQLDSCIERLQHFGNTQTQIVLSPIVTDRPVSELF